MDMKPSLVYRSLKFHRKRGCFIPIANSNDVHEKAMNKDYQKAYLLGVKKFMWL
jgi:hypothetical protein